MGLFDNALGSILSQASGSGGNPPVAQMLENLIQQHGGLGGLINQLQQGGLAQEAASWIGTGANLPVSGAQITQALGDGHIAQIAQQLGIDPQRAGGLLAQVCCRM
ncbi:MAG: YidB family protein [Pseudomonadota bacterium]